MYPIIWYKYLGVNQALHYMHYIGLTVTHISRASVRFPRRTEAVNILGQWSVKTIEREKNEYSCIIVFIPPLTYCDALGAHES